MEKTPRPDRRSGWAQPVRLSENGDVHVMKWMEAEYPADVDILVCECRWQIIPREIDIEAEERFNELDEIYRKDHPRPTEFNAIRKWENERLMTLEHQVMEEIVYKLRE